MDIEKLIDQVVELLKQHVAREIAKTQAQVDAALQAAIAKVPEGRAGRDGKDGVAGKSITIEQVEPMFRQWIADATKSLPVPRDGRDGVNGTDGVSVPLEAVQALVAAEVARAVASIPRPADGKDGASGKDGVNGKDGAPGRDGKDGADGLAGKDGAPGRDGKDGKPGERGPEGPMPTVDLSEVVDLVRADPDLLAQLRGERGEAGARGADGRDGRDGADGQTVSAEDLLRLTEQHFAKWALDFERLATDRQQRAIEAIPIPRDGRDGKDGRPGLGLEDFEGSLESDDDGRMLTLTLQAGSRTRVMRLRTATVLDRGAYSITAKYDKGDAITYGGNLWICQRDQTAQKPGDGPDWRLAVRRGKDGKDAGA